MSLTYVICTRNRSKLLLENSDNLKQSLEILKEKINVLIVDSNSDKIHKEKNKSIAQRFGYNYIYSEKEGLSVARNLAIRTIDTKYIYFLDDDVTVPKIHSKILFATLMKFGPDLIGGPVETIFPKSTPVWYDHGWNSRRFKDATGFGATRLSGGNFGGLVSVFQNLDGFREDLGMRGKKILVGEERDLIERYLFKTKIPKIFYSLDLRVEEPLPKSKTTFIYRVRREFAIGSALIYKKNKGYNNSSLRTWFRQTTKTFAKLKAFENQPLKIKSIRTLLKLSFILGLSKRNLIQTLHNKKRKKKKVIVLFFEHASRELPSLIKIQEFLNNTGKYKVYIYNISTDRWMFDILKPDCCFLPYFYNPETDVFQSRILKNPSVVFFSLSWEQIFYPAKVPLKIPQNLPPNIKLLIWTKSWHRKLLESGIPSSQILQLGHPLWSLIFQNKYTFSEKPSKTILYIENASLAFAKKKIFEKLNVDAVEIKKQFENLLEKNLRLLESIQRDQDVQVKIRIRPSTPKTDFIQFVNNRIYNNNFKFIKNGSIQNDIQEADCILTEMSTSALEAALTRKKVGLLNTNMIPNNFKYSWFKMFPMINNSLKMNDFLKSSSYPFDKINKWMSSENSLNQNYLIDLENVARIEIESKNHKLSPIFKMIRLGGSFYYSIWNKMFSYKTFRNIYFEIFEKNFSLSTHEGDIISKVDLYLFKLRGTI